MNVFKKILKWVGVSIGSLLLLIVLAGLGFRLGTPTPQPPGKLVDVGGYQLHINSAGEKSNKPTVVLETGQGLPTEHYHWLSESLKDSLRVIRYDRAGIGYSDLSHTPRDPATIARELHTLLEKAGESPPYILAGHSFGGLFIRVFAQLYPDEVVGMVFLDASHPDQRERLNFSERKDMSKILSTVAVLADMGIIGPLDRFNGSMLYVEDFPKEINDRFYDYTNNGKYFRGLREEVKWDQAAYDQSRMTKDFGSLPIRVFTANKKYSGKEANPEWVKLQREIADLSTAGEQILVDGHHNSIYTTEANAKIIGQEIIALVGELGY